MRAFARTHWPVAAGILIFLGTMAVLVRVALRNCQHQFVYPLDDPYIHMAMAKNLARSGVWGITRYNFTSSSSSPLWTLLLSATYLLAGVSSLAPLFWNLAAAVALLVAVHMALRASPVGTIWLLIAMLAMVLLVPLPVVAFTGQEHVLHSLLTIVFVSCAGKELQDPSPSLRARRPVLLFLLAPLLTLVRYEAFFLVLVVCALLLLRRRLACSLLLGLLALAPAGIYAALSVAQGWLPLPNPVLMKGNLTRVIAPLLNGKGGAAVAVANLLGYAAFKQFLKAPHMLFLVVTIVALLVLHIHRKGGPWESTRAMAWCFLGTTFLHLQFARTGWFYRYEAYLIALGLFVLLALGADLWGGGVSWNATVGVLVLIPFAALGPRAAESLSRVPLASENIYEQQYQMGRFLERYYRGEAVAANDVGAINFYADIRCLDLGGLASMEVADLKRGMRYGPKDRYDLAKSKNVRIALVYDETFAEWGGLPPQWIKVGSWKISRNVVCGGDTVSFYAVDEEERAPLVRHLREYSSGLPRTVEEAGSYLDFPGGP